MRVALLSLFALMSASYASAQVGAGSSGDGRTVVINSPVQAPPTPLDGTGAISGVVTDAMTKRPIGGAMVSLNLQATGPATPLRRGAIATTMTDEKGRFLFRQLPASTGYTVSASKLGYFDGGFGKKPTSPALSRIEIADRQWFNGADFEMWRPGAIGGRVIDEQGEPVVDAYVRVLRLIMVAGVTQFAAGPVALTDDRGMYRIAGLAPGQFLVSVPSVQMSVPTSAPDPPPTGSGFASAGPPAGSAPISPDAPIDFDSTHRLIVGRYLIPPPLLDGKTFAYPITFYPNATALMRANPVELAFGEDRDGVDIGLTPLPAWRISGIVQGPPEVVSRLTLRLMPPGTEDLGFGSEAATARVAPDGSFMFLSVPAGEYTIDARGTIAQFESDDGAARYRLPMPPGAAATSASATSITSSRPSGVGLTTLSLAAGNAYWGRLAVAVGDRDLTNLVVVLQRSNSLSGRLVFDGEASPPRPLVLVEPANGGAAIGQLSNPPTQTGAFEIGGLFPGQYFLRALGIGDLWTLKSVMVGDRDYTRMALDTSGGRDFTNIVATFTDKTTSISGFVTGANGTPAATGAVIAFPIEAEQWRNYGRTPARIKATRLTTASGYRITGLPAGEYLVVAVDESQFDAWQDPNFLEVAARGATRVSLTWGDSVTRDLRVSR